MNQGQFVEANGLLMIQQFINILNEAFPMMPVKKMLIELLKEEIENQILNGTVFEAKDKNKLFCFTLYMLSGVLYQFSEDEFYLNLVVLLNALFRMTNRLLNQNYKVITKYKKKSGVVSGCKAQVHSNLEDDPTQKEFYDQLKELRRLLSGYVIDEQLNSDVELRNIQIEDPDLRKFLDSLGGFQKIYQTILYIWLQFKSIFRNDDVNYLFEGMQQLVLKSQDLTSPVQSFSRYLDQDLI